MRSAVMMRAVLAVLAVGVLAQPAMASICSHKSVSAPGQPSAFAFVAKSRAKAAWRAAVTADPQLGPDYAVWGIAEARVFDCRSVPPRKGFFGQTICTATAAACKFDPPAAN